MWKKRIFYGVVLVLFLRLGWSLYSMMPSVFSQGSVQAQSYFVSPAYYEQQFKKALEVDVAHIVDNAGANNESALDYYIGSLLAEKEQKNPGFSKLNRKAIEELRTAVKEYVSFYTTCWNESKWDDLGGKPGKREIQQSMYRLVNTKIKPLLDTLIYMQDAP